MPKKLLTSIIILTGILVEVTWVAGIVSGPVFMRLLNLSNTQLGIALGSLNIGLLIFSPVAGNISFRMGAARVFFYGLLGMTAGISLIVIGSDFPILMSGMILTGVANAFIINANMTILSELFPSMIRRIISLYSALYFGGCALVAPLIGQWLKFSSERGWHFFSFRMPFFLLMLIFMCLSVLAHRLIVPLVAAMHLKPSEEKSKISPGGRGQGVSKWFWVPLLAFFHGLMYIVMVSWLSPMARQKFGANEFEGSLFVGAATLGMCLGRLSIAGLRLPWEDRKVLSAGTIVGGGMLFAGLLVNSYVFSLALIGLGSFIASTSFPCISSLGGDMFKEMRPRVFGYMYASYAVAGIVGTPLAGMLADSGVSLSWVLTISAFSALMMGIISIIWKYGERKDSPA